MKRNLLPNTRLGDALLALISGLLLIASLPGHLELWPLAYFALVPLLAAVRRGNLHPFVSGYIAGAVAYLGLLAWLTSPVSHFGGAPFAVGVLVLIGFSLVLAVQYGVFAYVAGRYDHAVVLATVFVCLEVVKGIVFTGFPWLNLAQSQYLNLPALQWVSLFGEHGLSFMIVLINVFLFRALSLPKRGLIMAATTLAVLFAFGGVRLLAHDNGLGDEADRVRVKLLQPAYSQEIKWQPEKKKELTDLVNGMLKETAFGAQDMVILPESAYPAFIEREPEILDIIRGIAKTTPVLLGGNRVSVKDGKRTYHNSMFLFAPEGVSLYDKLHLVPFGEYFPLGDLFQPIKYYFFGEGEMFSPGRTSVVLKTGKMKLAPLICYEGAFSHMVRGPVMDGANLIALVSNDSWFGGRLGMRQHLAIDVIRAAEYDRAIVRATQSGISAVILPDGTISSQTDIGVQTSLTADAPLKSGFTLFSFLSNSWLLAMLVWSVFLIKRSRERQSGE